MKQYLITDIKLFMQKLLMDNENCFDSFLINEAVISTFSTFTIDGHLNPSFYSKEELEEMKLQAEGSGRIFSEKMVRWERLKNMCYQLIKGKHTPTSFRFSFYLSDENTDKFLSSLDTGFTRQDIDGLSLIIRYDGEKLTAVSNASLHVFSLDQTLTKSWDNMVARFFTKNGIAFE